MKTAIIVVLCLFAICSRADLISDMLTAHNNARSKYNIQPLKWNAKIASQALDWATYLAKNDKREHSGTSGVGENLARGTSGKYSPTRLFGLWESEKQYFIVGKNYPDCSTTGSKSDVGHYTAIMWATTTEVGCGFADYKKAVLVCQYKEPGNKKGYPVFNANGNNPNSGSSNSGSSNSGSSNSGSSNSGSSNSGSSDSGSSNSGSSNSGSSNSGSSNSGSSNSGSSSSTPTTKFSGISWSQFKGKVDSRSSFWSYTIWNAPYTYSSKTSGNNVKITVKSKCELDQSSSWVKSQYKTDELLRHEQGHYFIGSIFAMTFKKQAEAKTFSKSNYKSEISKLYNNLLDEFLDYEVRYDKETDHFKNKDMQKKWEADLINQINDLKDYWW